MISFFFVLLVVSVGLLGGLSLLIWAWLVDPLWAFITQGILVLGLVHLYRLTRNWYRAQQWTVTQGQTSLDPARLDPRNASDPPVSGGPANGTPPEGTR